MASPLEILSAIRRLRNDVMARRSNGDARGKLENQCDRISALDIPGDDWASADMTDPLFPDERGHSIRIIAGEGKTGMIVSLTGKKIIGTVTHRENDALVMQELTSITGAKSWRKKSHAYTRR